MQVLHNQRYEAVLCSSEIKDLTFNDMWILYFSFELFVSEDCLVSQIDDRKKKKGIIPGIFKWNFM